MLTRHQPIGRGRGPNYQPLPARMARGVGANQIWPLLHAAGEDRCSTDKGRGREEPARAPLHLGSLCLIANKLSRALSLSLSPHFSTEQQVHGPGEATPWKQAATSVS